MPARTCSPSGRFCTRWQPVFFPSRETCSGAIFDCILNRHCDVSGSLEPGGSAELEHIINKALEKDREVRYQHASEMKADLKRLERDSTSGGGHDSKASARAKHFPVPRGRSCAGSLAFDRCGRTVLLRSDSQAPVTSPSEYTQITNFTDSAVAPSLSPDGRMVTFKRGEDAFFSNGQIYVKLLPNGESVQLTNDATPSNTHLYSHRTDHGSRIPA